MMRRTMLAAVVVVLAAGLAACGEREQVVVYKQGAYQGKRDMAPYAGAPWNGNRNEWIQAIQTRNKAQNEHKRIGN